KSGSPVSRCGLFASVRPRQGRGSGTDASRIKSGSPWPSGAGVLASHPQSPVQWRTPTSSCRRSRLVFAPAQCVVIEVVVQRGLDDAEVRGDVEITGHEERVI